MENRWTVWVGGSEVNDYYLDYETASDLAEDYVNKGYANVVLTWEDDS
jgi:hypothetical protein